MRALRYIFSFHGRVTAGDIWRHQWATAGVTFPILLGVTAALWTFTDGLSFFYGFAAAIAVQSVAHLSATVRRLHDFGLSGWWVAVYPPVLAVLIGGWFNTFGLREPYDVLSPILFGVFMLTTITLFIFLYLVPGQRGANRYGEPLA